MGLPLIDLIAQNQQKNGYYLYLRALAATFRIVGDEISNTTKA